MSETPENSTLDPVPAPASAEQTPQQEVKREVVELVKMVLLFLVLFWGLKTFIVEGYEVQGQSMQPTLEDRERILVLKFPIKLSKLPLLGGLDPVDAGDLVVFDSTDFGETSSSGKRYIKRIIAEGPERARGNVAGAEHRDGEAPSGDAVSVLFDRGNVYVNNQQVQEDYLDERERKSRDKRAVTYLEAGKYYVLGDHRGVSKDSRVFGPIDERQIIGKAVFRFWPLSKFGPL